MSQKEDKKSNSFDMSAKTANLFYRLGQNDAQLAAELFAEFRAAQMKAANEERQQLLGQVFRELLIRPLCDTFQEAEDAVAEIDHRSSQNEAALCQRS